MLRSLAQLAHRLANQSAAAGAVLSPRLFRSSARKTALQHSNKGRVPSAGSSLDLLASVDSAATAAAARIRTQQGSLGKGATAAAGRGRAWRIEIAAAAAEMQQEPTQPARQQQRQQFAHLQMSADRQQQLLDAVKDRPPVIFYHYPCPDGVFAALAAWLFFSGRGTTPTCVPLEVYKPAPSPTELQLQPGSVAFLLDYAGPEGFPQQLAQQVSQVVVLDHHKTAAQQLSDKSTHPPNLAVCLDMARSGATIARDFFDPPGMSSSLQLVYRWVEDADLWRWALPDSQAFHAGLSALKLDYHAGRNPGLWDQLQQLDVPAVLEQGAQVLKYQEQLVSAAVGAARPYQLGGASGLTRGWGVCLGAEVVGDLVIYRSRLGNSLALASKERGLAPVGLVAYTEADQPSKETEVKVSLRSVDGFDTSAVTGAFGGGGHAAASSCIIRRDELRSWQDMSG